MDKIYSGYANVTLSTADYEKSIVKSARRVLQGFEFFAEYQHPALASQIAANLDLPQSSTSMLLRSLVQLGYLQFDSESRLFEPTLRLSLLSAWRPERVCVASAILEVMRKLHDATGQSVQLAEPYRNCVRYIYVLQSADPDRTLYVPHGTLRPICSTAFGQVLLTLKSEKEMRSIIARARLDEDSVDYGVDPDSIMTAVARAREHGYAHTSRASGDFEAFQIATLLPQTSGYPPMALGVTSQEQNADKKKDTLNLMFELLGKKIRHTTLLPPSKGFPDSKTVIPAKSRS